MIKSRIFWTKHFGPIRFWTVFSKGYRRYLDLYIMAKNEGDLKNEDDLKMKTT